MKTLNKIAALIIVGSLLFLFGGFMGGTNVNFVTNIVPAIQVGDNPSIEITNTVQSDNQGQTNFGDNNRQVGQPENNASDTIATVKGLSFLVILLAIFFLLWYIKAKNTKKNAYY